MAEPFSSPTVCAYCGCSGPFTSEHLMPRAIVRAHRQRLGYDITSFVPADPDSPFSGNKTIRDVCRKCNGGPLSRLDSAAVHWLREPDMPFGILRFAVAEQLSRWAAKIVFNFQRFLLLKGSKHPVEPFFPTGLSPWILGMEPVTELVQVCAGLLPVGHPERNAIQVSSFRDPRLASNHVVIKGHVFMVCWLNSELGRSPQVLASYYAERFGTVRVDSCGGVNPTLRVIRDPEPFLVDDSLDTNAPHIKPHLRPL